jgi:hypothetical protein
MNTTEPKRPDAATVVSDEEREIYVQRLKTLEQDRKKAIPAAEAFRRILEKPKP